MPVLSTQDLARERQEAAANLLPDTCNVNVYTWSADAGGGRYRSGVTTTEGIACRLVEDTHGTEYVNRDTGMAQYSQWTIILGPDVVSDDVLGPASAGTYDLELVVTSLNGAPTTRYFDVIFYGAHSEMVLRQMHCRENV